MVYSFEGLPFLEIRDIPLIRIDAITQIQSIGAMLGMTSVSPPQSDAVTLLASSLYKAHIVNAVRERLAKR